MQKLVALLLAVSLSGCATSPIPENYSGPLATVRDTAVSETSNRAQFFYLAQVDGQPVENVLGATRRANSGRGFAMSPVTFSREVPANPSTFTLAGRVAYGAPIQEIVNSGTVYTVEKKVTVTPRSNTTYVVKGTLTAERQDVWLEDSTGKRVE